MAAFLGNPSTPLSLVVIRLAENRARLYNPATQTRVFIHCASRGSATWRVQKPEYVYRCDFCDKSVCSNTPCNRFPSILRKKTYPQRSKANKFRDPSNPNKRDHIYKDDPGGSGYETVVEINVCPICALSVPPAKTEQETDICAPAA